VPNKTTTLLKDAPLKAAETSGRSEPDGIVSYRAVQAEQNPGPFMALLGKVLSPRSQVGARATSSSRSSNRNDHPSQGWHRSISTLIKGVRFWSFFTPTAWTLVPSKNRAKDSL